MTMQSRLLHHLPRVFDTSPAPVLALRLRSGGGLTWRLANDVLTVRRPDQADTVVPLSGLTILALRDILTAAGIEIAYANPDVFAEGAMALLPGAGDQDASNGDHLWLATSLVWAWTAATGRALDVARTDIVEALRQLVVKTAEGRWLDYWGGYFGIRRHHGEDDPTLRLRIDYEWRRSRSNAVALQANIKRLTGQDVQIREPWREMMTLSESPLSGADHLPDAREFCYHTAQLWSPDFLDWAPIMREAMADRPAGTLLLPPVTVPPPWAVACPVPIGEIPFAGHVLGTWQLNINPPDGHILSDNASLSNSFYLKNPQLIIIDAHDIVAPDVLSDRRAFPIGEISVVPFHVTVGPWPAWRNVTVADHYLYGTTIDPAAIVGSRDDVSVLDPSTLFGPGWHGAWSAMSWNNAGFVTPRGWYGTWSMRPWGNDQIIVPIGGILAIPFTLMAAPSSDERGVTRDDCRLYGAAFAPVLPGGREDLLALDLPEVFGEGWHGRWSARPWHQHGDGYAIPVLSGGPS